MCEFLLILKAIRMKIHVTVIAGKKDLCKKLYHTGQDRRRRVNCITLISELRILEQKFQKKILLARKNCSVVKPS